MQKRILIEWTVFIVIIGLIVTGIYYLFNYTTEKIEIVSIENEEKLGKLIYENLVSQNDEIHNATLDSALTIIKDRIIPSINNREYTYKMSVIENKEANAFTLPGGYIVIYSGLIQFADSPEEVAAVLSHEIGHAEKKHVIKRIIKDVGISVLLSGIGGGDAVLLEELGKEATSNYFNREQEEEADQFGMDVLVKSKINPLMLAQFFRKLEEKHGDVSKPMELLSTHPNLQSRIKACSEYKLPEEFKEESLPIDWKKVQSVVDSLTTSI